jgi:phosphate transport system permease protein
MPKSLGPHSFHDKVTMENVQPGGAPQFRRVARFVSPIDRGFAVIVYAGSLLFALLILGLFIELLHGSWPSIAAFGPSFIWHSEWNPIANKFGALPMIYGTVVTSLIAIIFAAFIGILAAVYLADFAPRWLAAPLSFLIELLAAVPSVVYGLWGLFVLSPFVRTAIGPALQSVLGWTPLFSGPIYGVGLLTGGLILALMIVPTVTAISRDVVAAIPRDLREASMALGSTKWETAMKVVLPAARVGIFGACVLALGRALGETIAVTMVIGNRPDISASLFAPSYTLASVIANEFTEATTDLYISALIQLGLILFFVSVIVNAIARVMIWSVRGSERTL